MLMPDTNAGRGRVIELGIFQRTLDNLYVFSIRTHILIAQWIIDRKQRDSMARLVKSLEHIKSGNSIAQHIDWRN
jgi:hypothetical protein